MTGIAVADWVSNILTAPWFWAAASAIFLGLILFFGDEWTQGFLRFLRRRAKFRAIFCPLEDGADPERIHAYVNCERLPPAEIIASGLWTFDTEQTVKLDYDFEGVDEEGDPNPLGKGFSLGMEANLRQLAPLKREDFYLVFWIATEDTYHEATYYVKPSDHVISMVGWRPFSVRARKSGSCSLTSPLIYKIRFWILFRIFLWKNNIRGV